MFLFFGVLVLSIDSLWVIMHFSIDNISMPFSHMLLRQLISCMYGSPSPNGT